VFFTAITAQDMDMGAARFIEKPGDEKFFVPEDRPANRADPAEVSFQAVTAARYVHQSIGTGDGGKGGGFYPFAPFQLGGTNRTGPGRSGEARAFGLGFGAPFPQNRHGKSSGEGEKEGISKPDKEYSRNGKE
jgi:hypothetical protein